MWRLFFAGLSVPPSIVALSGRIEGDDSAVAAKTTGRLLEIRVREGDDVKAGDVIAILDDEQVQARHEQAASALVAAEAKTSAAKAQVAVLREQLKQSRLSEDQSKSDAQGRVDQAEANLTAAEADLAQQEASYKLALFDKDAYTRLAQLERFQNGRENLPFPPQINRRPRLQPPSGVSRQHARCAHDGKARILQTRRFARLRSPVSVKHN